MTFDSERRNHGRYLLPPSETITALMLQIDRKDWYIFTARIPDICEGGLGLAVPNIYSTIRWGSPIMVKGLLDSQNFYFLVGVKMKIRWIKHDPYLQYRAVGCEFLSVDEKIKRGIRDLFAA